MMPRSFTNLHDFEVQLRRDMRKRMTRIRGAVRKAARDTRNYVARNTVPKAFGELADALYVQDAVNGSAVVCDAPHAAAVENGSRPHTPPLEPLIAWVALRGVQGLTETGRVKSNRLHTVEFDDKGVGHRVRTDRVGDSRKESARRIAESLATALPSRKVGVYGVIGQAGQWRQRAAFNLANGNHAALAADPATVAIARAIQQGIKAHGTKPQPYMRAAIPEAEDLLAHFVEEALPDKD